MRAWTGVVGWAALIVFAACGGKVAGETTQTTGSSGSGGGSSSGFSSGSSGTTSGSSGGGSSSGVGGGSSASGGSSSSGGSSGVVVDASVACAPLSNLGGFAPKWVPPAPHQSACTQQNIDDFLKFCLGPTPDQNACNSFIQSANGQKCYRCLQTADTAAAYGPLVAHQSVGSVELNVAGCIALATGDSSASGCGAAVEAEEQCGNAACVNCPAITDQISLDGYNQCTADAQVGVCAPYATAAQCADKLADAGNAAVQSCTSGTTFEQAYANIAPLFCL